MSSSIPRLGKRPLGNTIPVVVYLYDEFDGSEVTSVTSIAGRAWQISGASPLDADIDFTVAQVGSTNVWQGQFDPTSTGSWGYEVYGTHGSLLFRIPASVTITATDPTP